MAYQETPVDAFGGLDLKDDPEEVGPGAAVDMLNMDVSSRGRLRTRNGTSTWVSATGGSDNAQHMTTFRPLTVVGDPNEYLAVAYQSGASTGYVRLYDEAGVQVTTRPDLAGNIVRYGTPSSGSTIWYADGTQLRSFTILGFGAGSLPSGSAKYVEVSPVDNRLVVAAVATSFSRVWFSDPGDPGTFGANNYVDLDPGDGEEIQGIATWGNDIIVFKETKLYRFYGTSVSGTGTPVFNYATVRSGIGVKPGLYSDPPRHVVARDGVYFVGLDGIYRTNGDVPVKVSQQLDPWFQGLPLPLASSLPTNDGDHSLSADQRYVYFRAGTRTFALDTQTGEWTLYSLAIRDTTSTGAGTRFALTGKVVTSDPDLTDDSGSAITWRYRTGASDLGVPVEKLVKQAQVWGSGTVTASVYTDHATTDPGATALTLGTAPAVARGQQFYSRKGTFFSLGLSGTGPAVIHRAVFGVAEQRLAGVG